jgi:hypothetical protein
MAWKLKLAMVLASAAALSGCMSDASRRAEIVQDTRCVDFAFPVYFQPHADTLTTPAAQSIALAVSRTKGCHVASLTLSGLTVDGDDALVARRADTITKALAANGLASPVPAVDATEHTGGMMHLLGRRTEVRVHMGGKAG